MKKLWKPTLLLLASGVLLSFLSVPAIAVPIWGTSALGSLTGERFISIDSDELNGAGSWINDFSISWKVSKNENSSYTYEYTLSTAPSHFILEITSGAEEGKTYTKDGQGNSNPSMPNEIFGVKFDNDDDEDNKIFTLITDRSPVWGNFYAKAGMSSGTFNAIWNQGLGSDYSQSADSKYFIVRPNGGSMVVPEPSTLLLLGCGLTGLAVCARNQKRK